MANTNPHPHLNSTTVADELMLSQPEVITSVQGDIEMSAPYTPP